MTEDIVNDATPTPAVIDDAAFQKYKRMGTGQLRNAVAKLHAAATGQDPDEINWDSYDRGGLLEVVKHRHTQLTGKGATIVVNDVSAEDAQDDVILEDDGLTIAQPPLSPKRRARPVELETKEVVLDADGNPVTPGKKVKAEKAPKAPKPPREPKPVVEKGPRKRRIADEIIQALRYRRATETPVQSYAKLAAWLLAEYAITVTGDLVRSIIVKEIYREVVDLPLPEPVAVEPAVTTADLEAAYVGLADAHALESDGAMDAANLEADA